MDARIKPALPMTGRELEETLGYLDRVCEIVLPCAAGAWHGRGQVCYADFTSGRKRRVGRTPLIGPMVSDR